jgi:hypothetical protein
MLTDHYFTIGSTHTVCQDYAASGGNWIALSDGCSGSTCSDFGSRLLTRITGHMLTACQQLTPDRLVRAVLRQAHRAARQIYLPEASLDATLFAAWYHDDRFSILTAGDGVLALTLKNGESWIISLEYPSGYPFYCNYLTNPGRLRDFSSSSPCVAVKCFYRSDNEYQCTGKPEWLIPIESIPWIYTVNIPSASVEWCAIFSDGVHSFVTRSSREGRMNPVFFKDIVQELIRYKSFTGEFAARRTRRVLKEMAVENCTNQDDLSVAVMKL